MFSTPQLDELKKLHKNHIANTFLFTSKVLDQYKRITDAHAEAMHGMLRDFSAASAFDGSDPMALTQNAINLITKGLATQGDRSSNFISETAAAYAEIMRLVVEYGNDTFAGLQSASRSATAQGSTSPQSLQNAWVAPFMSAFQNAANLMTAGLGTIAAAQSGVSNGSASEAKSSAGSRRAAK